MNSRIFAIYPSFSPHNKSPIISLSYNLDNLTTHFKAFFFPYIDSRCVFTGHAMKIEVSESFAALDTVKFRK